MMTSDMPSASGAPSQIQPTNAPAAMQPAQRYRMIFGVTLSVVTVIALVLAYASSDFRQSGATAIPSTWKQVYSADLTGINDGAWKETEACRLDALGLDATGSSSAGALCVFQPSVKDSVTSEGFYFETTLAPAAKVPAFVRTVVSVGDISEANAPSGSVVHFVIGQDGSYTLYDNAGSSSRGGIYQQGGLAAWHGNALLANTVAMKVSPDHSTLTVYVNGQEVATVFPSLGAQPDIAVGTTSDSEAIFTHARLYTGQ